MKLRVTRSCPAVPSIAGYKGFLYPDDNRSCLIKEGTVVEFLSYVSIQAENDLRAVAIKNSSVEGSAPNDKLGVYWISRKNLEDAD